MFSFSELILTQNGLFILLVVMPISILEFHIVMAQRIANTNHAATDMAIWKYQPC